MRKGSWLKWFLTLGPHTHISQTRRLQDWYLRWVSVLLSIDGITNTGQFLCFLSNLTAEGGSIPKIRTRWLGQNTSFLHEIWFSSEVTGSKSLNWIYLFSLFFFAKLTAIFFLVRSVEDVKHFFKPLSLQFEKRFFFSRTFNIRPEHYLVISVGSHPMRCFLVHLIDTTPHTPFPLRGTATATASWFFLIWSIHFRTRAMSASGCSMGQRSVTIQ